MSFRKLAITLAISVSLFSADMAVAKTSRLTDDQVKQQIIDESIESYPGTCACPFNSARNGSSCGGRSAWSRDGGYSPICYKKEVTKAMIAEWRQNHDS